MSTGVFSRPQIRTPCGVLEDRESRLLAPTIGGPMIAYLAILTTAIAAFCGAPIWAIIPGAGILLAISVSEQRKLSARFAAIGSSHMLVMAAWQSAGHALMACGAAWALGAVVGHI
jgi:hypothetical protein